MRHYEVVFLVHPDQSEQVPAMVDRYRTLVETNAGMIHRFEDWGRRPMAFMIAGVYKAHYVLMNIECDNETLAELNSMFKFSDAILRNLVIKKNRAITEPSFLAKSKEENQEENKEENKSATLTSEQAEAGHQSETLSEDELISDPAKSFPNEEETEARETETVTEINITIDGVDTESSARVDQSMIEKDADGPDDKQGGTN